MFRTPLFAPPAVSPGAAQVVHGPARERVAAYRFNERIVAAVNVAMAARRPLLVTGEPGCGKSSLAHAVARELERAFVDYVFTSRSTLADLTVGHDAVRRLADAQLGADRVLPDPAYLRPGVLWWAFAPESARTRGNPADLAGLTDDQRGRLPIVADPRRRRDGAGTVVLLDEIDKADPDLPNDLLVPLDGTGFDLPDGTRITADREVLVIITSNEERLLPPAFLRRCVRLTIAMDDDDFFLDVARAHFEPRRDTLFEDIAEVFVAERKEAARRSRRPPSTAEYLDTIRACLELGSGPGEPFWDEIVAAAMTKAR